MIGAFPYDDLIVMPCELRNVHRADDPSKELDRFEDSCDLYKMKADDSLSYPLLLQVTELLTETTLCVE